MLTNRILQYLYTVNKKSAYKNDFGNSHSIFKSILTVILKWFKHHKPR